MLFLLSSDLCGIVDQDRMMLYKSELFVFDYMSLSLYVYVYVSVSVFVFVCRYDSCFD